MQINGTTEVTFTPDSSGLWRLQTYDNGNSDPYLVLMDSDHIYIDDDDDGGEGYNSMLCAYLDEGTTYIIEAGFYGDGTGSFTLNAKLSEYIPRSGGSVHATGADVLAFTPDRTGVWDIRASGSVSELPFLSVYSSGTQEQFYRGYNESGDTVVHAMLYKDFLYVVQIEYYHSVGECTINVAFEHEVETLSSDTALPAEGGMFVVDAPSTFTFAPDRGGYWSIYTSDNLLCDPYLELYDNDGNLIMYDDDGGDRYNARLFVYLDSGEPCTIAAMCYDNAVGTYVLNLEVVPEMPSAGGVIQVLGNTTFAFVPNRSGMWEFETSDCGEYDPFLHIYDIHGDMIGYDDDGGEGYNALLSVYLDSGEVYIIDAIALGTTQGTYTLTVTGS